MAWKKLNDLSGKTKLISTKRLRKNSINVHIVNGVKYFIEDGSQIYLIFQPVIIKYFKASRMTVSIMVMVWKFNTRMKVLNPLLHQIIVLETRLF